MRVLIAAGFAAWLGAAHAAPIPSDWSGDASRLDDEAPVYSLDSLPVPPLGTPELREALAAIREGRPQDVEALVRESLGRRESAAPAHELLGIALAMQGRIAQARSEFERSLQANPKQVTAAIKLGDLAAAQGNFAEADRLYERAREIDASDPQLAQRLGLAAERRGDLQAAIDWYRKGLVGVAPEYLGVRLNLAGLYNRTGEPQRAIELLAGHPRRDSSAAALFHLGVAHTQLGQLETAVDELERARRLAPQLWNAALALGVAQRLRGDATASLVSLRDAARLAPRSPLPAVELGRSLLVSGRVDDAIAEFERAAAVSGGRPAYRLELAKALLAAGRNDRAIASFDELSKIDGAPLEVGLGRATAYRNAGRLDEAARAYDRLREAAPNNAEVLYQAGLFEAFRRHYDDAVELLTRAARDPSHRPRALRAAAFAYGQKGDHTKATGLARTLVAESDGSADAFVTLALLLEQSGSRDDAADAYERALRADPEHALALNNLAVLRGAQGDRQAALALAERAHRAAPQDPQVLDTWGWALQRAGRSAEAVEALRESLRRAPGSATARYHLGVARLSIGERDAARADLAEAVKLDPDASWADDARRRLEGR